MAFRQAHGFGQFLDGRKLTGFRAPPPTPCSADGPQYVRVPHLILAGAKVGGRHDLWSPILPTYFQRDQHADRIVRLDHSTASILRGVTISRMTPRDAFTPNIDLEPGGGDGDPPHIRRDQPRCYVSRSWVAEKVERGLSDRSRFDEIGAPVLNHREMSKTGVRSLLPEQAGHFCRRSELPHHGDDLPTENLAHLRLVTGNKR